MIFEMVQICKNVLKIQARDHSPALSLQNTEAGDMVALSRLDINGEKYSDPLEIYLYA